MTIESLIQSFEALAIWLFGLGGADGSAGIMLQAWNWITSPTVLPVFVLSIFLSVVGFVILKIRSAVNFY